MIIHFFIISNFKCEKITEILVKYKQEGIFDKISNLRFD